jgi:AcrR family transcriptional regulator
MMEDTGMAQVKKAIVRDAIMRAAFDLFSQKDYAATSLVDIAREAGVSPASLYVYFPSKLNLFWAVLQPWLVAQMDKLEREIQKITDPRSKLEHILYALWGNIPAANFNLVANFVHGVAMSTPGDVESQNAALYLEDRLNDMLQDCIPADRRAFLGRNTEFSQFVILTFDGLIVTNRLRRSQKQMDDLVRIACMMALGAPDEAGILVRRQTFPCYDPKTCNAVAISDRY